METTSLTRILAFSAILAVGVGPRGVKSVFPVKSSPPDAYLPETGKSQRLPSKDDKTDCDDCVIVQNGSNGSGKASGSLLAGTLWGLFMVRRPRRTPRAIIRGITVP